MIAGSPGSSSILRRRFFTCESIVRSYPSNSYPRTRLISSNREYTRPGTVASATRMPHSVGVSSTSVPRTTAERRGSSMTSVPVPNRLTPCSAAAGPPRRRMACTRSTSSRGLNGLVT
jgi:hypothetical protein